MKGFYNNVSIWSYGLRAQLKAKVPNSSVNIGELPMGCSSVQGKVIWISDGMENKLLYITIVINFRAQLGRTTAVL